MRPSKRTAAGREQERARKAAYKAHQLLVGRCRTCGELTLNRVYCEYHRALDLARQKVRRNARQEA